MVSASTRMKSCALSIESKHCSVSSADMWVPPRVPVEENRNGFRHRRPAARRCQVRHQPFSTCRFDTIVSEIGPWRANSRDTCGTLGKSTAEEYDIHMLHPERMIVLIAGLAIAAAEPVKFNRDIRPIMSDICF